MKDFLAAFVLLVIVGYGFLALGGALGLALFGVAVAAVVIAGLISLLGKLEDLEKKLDALTAAGAAPEGESTPPEADDGEAPADSAEH